MDHLTVLNDLARTSRGVRTLFDRLAALKEELDSANQQLDSANQQLDSANQQLAHHDHASLDPALPIVSPVLSLPSPSDIAHLENYATELEGELEHKLVQLEETQKNIRDLQGQLDFFEESADNLDRTVNGLKAQLKDSEEERKLSENRLEERKQEIMLLSRDLEDCLQKEQNEKKKRKRVEEGPVREKKHQKSNEHEGKKEKEGKDGETDEDGDGEQRQRWTIERILGYWTIPSTHMDGMPADDGRAMEWVRLLFPPLPLSISSIQYSALS
jgi:chromosome segregation ATPase